MSSSRGAYPYPCPSPGRPWLSRLALAPPFLAPGLATTLATTLRPPPPPPPALKVTERLPLRGDGDARGEGEAAARRATH